MRLVDHVGSSLLAIKAVGEKPSVFTTEYLKMILDRQTPEKVGGKKLGEGGEGEVGLPSTGTLFGSSAADLHVVDLQVSDLSVILKMYFLSFFFSFFFSSNH